MAPGYIKDVQQGSIFIFNTSSLISCQINDFYNSQSWKRKAKREARKLLGKGLLIRTGKSVATTPSTSTVVQQKASQGPKSVPPIHHTPITHHRAAVTVQKMEEHAVILRVVY